ncbi:MAG: DUF2849 domain-containing protein [Sphingomonadaceae bacterium]
MKLLTGNVTTTGDVVWWTGDGWSRRIEEATGLDAETGAALLAAEQARERINDLALIDAEPGPDGHPRPVHIRERIRAFGPTVRADLALAGRDWR